MHTTFEPCPGLNALLNRLSVYPHATKLLEDKQYPYHHQPACPENARQLMLSKQGHVAAAGSLAP